MFAFAIWGRRRRVLFAGRDRLGIKHFYYRWDGRAFLFGSEIKTILAYLGVAPEFNRGALAEYLAFGDLTRPETMFKRICKLNVPGHTLELSEGGERRLSATGNWEPTVIAIPTGANTPSIDTASCSLEQCHRIS